MPETKPDRTNSGTVYLGDGAYASFDGFTIELYTDREGVRHKIFLEPAAFAELAKFAERCWGRTTR